jgi:hypothetical protein
MAGRIVHAAMEESLVVPDPAERVQSLRLMYNIRGTINPMNREMYAPNNLGLLSEVVKAFAG